MGYKLGKAYKLRLLRAFVSGKTIREIANGRASSYESAYVLIRQAAKHMERLNDLWKHDSVLELKEKRLAIKPAITKEIERIEKNKPILYGSNQ